jgi:hypothetical protein
MPVWAWIVIGVAAALLVVGLLGALRVNRTKRLREGFGPEYDRVVEESDSRREAESELVERRKRREELDIRPLDPAARERYVELWRATQEEFVDDPERATGEADRLVSDVMRDRGYPVDDFERRAGDISVDYPELVVNYRSAHEISLRQGRGEATTEDLRQAMQHFRALFDELLGGTERELAEARRS